jgi:UDP-N-acetylmuramoyl-tripeptide--D-alanyl-D-alanine ligase
LTIILQKPVIAITGSSGKTTTKEMLASILKLRWKTYKSQVNRNNRQHMKQHVKKIRPDHQAVVLEFGMSFKGNLRQNCHIIQPNISVITMIGTAHIGNLGGSVPALIRAKSEIIQNMKPSGTLFLNSDDKNSKHLDFGRFKGQIVKIGIRHEADYQATEVEFAQGGMRFKVVMNDVSCQFYIPIYGSHNVYNALFAIAVADHLGFSPEQIKQGLRRYHKQMGRLIVYRLNNEIRVIDDTFNANPNSVKAALNVLNQIGGHNKIAVLGSMSELGKYNQRGHKEVGKYVGKNRVSRLFTYGKSARIIRATAISNGFPAGRAVHTNDREVLHKRLKAMIHPGTIILIKGSHDKQMYKTVSYLKKNI